jgi:hypothetical protein
VAQLRGGTSLVAERAGHSVTVLFRVYAKFVKDGDEAANAKISAAWGSTAERPETPSTPRPRTTRWGVRMRDSVRQRTDRQGA